MKLRIAIILGSFALLIAGCLGEPAGSSGQDGRLTVVATTTIVGDVVANVAGDLIELAVLLPSGADPHRFDPSPVEARMVAEADLVFINGAGLDAFVLNLVPEDYDPEALVSVSEGIELIHFAEAEAEGETEHESDADPHVWMDPVNVIIWTENIATALVSADPAHAAEFQANATAYTERLQELDGWIQDQFSSLPLEDRLLVSDHDSLGYFAAAYDFTVVGFVIPGFSTLAQPSAQELAALVDAIEASSAQKIYVDPSFNASLAEAVASDTGVELVPVFTASLSEAGGPAETYIDLMQSFVMEIGSP